jgi:hypothetical protein
MNKPILYAKIYGTLLTITTILAVISLVVALSRGINLPTSPFQSAMDTTLPMAGGMILIIDFIALVAGYGLIKSKVYGIYSLIILTIVQILYWLREPTFNYLLVLGIAITVYFYFQRKVFKK